MRQVDAERKTGNGQPRMREAMGLVVFAHPDLWSSLQSIAWCRQEGALESLCVYHTEETRGDADRLRRFCARQWPELKVIVPGEAGTPRAAKVVERLRDWRLFRSELPRWCLDCTGAGPTMLAGVSRAALEDPAWSVICRTGKEGAWQRLQAAPGGILDPAPPGPCPPAGIADDLPITELLPALATSGETSVLWRESRAPLALPAGEMARIVAAGGAANWSWRRMYETVLERPCPAEEWDFEDFLASVLLALGLTNVRAHVRLQLAARPPAEQTVDVVAIHEGQVWFLDCRPRLETEGGGRETRLWGDFGGRRVVVRPGRSANATERLLAAGGRTLLLDGDDCREIFTRLGEALGREVPPDLREAERRSLAPGACRLPVFAPATPAQQFSDAIHLDTCVFDLQRGAEADTGGEPPPWLAARVAPDLWFLGGRLPRPAPAPELRTRLDDRLAKSRLGCAVVFFEVAPDRLRWRSLVRTTKDRDADFGRWLGRWRNVPLIV